MPVAHPWTPRLAAGRSAWSLLLLTLVLALASLPAHLAHPPWTRATAEPAVIVSEASPVDRAMPADGSAEPGTDP